MSSLFDLVLPKKCVGCRAEGSWFCDYCRLPFAGATQSVCADCSQSTEEGRYCPTHADQHRLSGLVYVGPFVRGPLREAIHTLKYDAVCELAVPLGKLLTQKVSCYSVLGGALVVPIPLHRRRLAERGFNQAELIAQQLPSYHLLSYQPARALIRYGVRPPQVKLDGERRRRNIGGVFGVPKLAQPLLRGRTVLLVDDVATTCSTLDEAAGVLLKAGARAVWGAVIARDW